MANELTPGKATQVSIHDVSHDHPEAWWVIAGELPPGASKTGYRDDVEWHKDHYLSPYDAWLAFTEATGITRKKHAERIAFELVSDAAGDRRVSYRDDGDSLGFAFSVWVGERKRWENLA